MAAMEQALQDYLKNLGVSDKAIANIETEEITTLVKLHGLVQSCASNTELRAALSVTFGASSTIWNDLKNQPVPGSTPSTAPSAPAAAPAPTAQAAAPSTPTAPAASGGMGGMEALFKRLIPPQTLMEALILLADDPNEQRSQQFWVQFAGGDSTLLAEASPGVIDLDTSKGAVTIFNESGIAPDELDGKTLYTLAQFLKKVVLVCPFLGDRLVQGRGLSSGVSYRLIGLKTDKLKDAKALPGMQLIAFAAAENLVSAASPETVKRQIVELGGLIRGLHDMSDIKDAVDGTQWGEVIRQIDLDARAGGSKMTAALTRLVGTVSPNRPSRAPAPANPLAQAFGALGGRAVAPAPASRRGGNDPLAPELGHDHQTWS